MKRTKLVIAIVLLFSLLLSSCGQAALPIEESEQYGAEETALEAAEVPEMELPPFRDFPPEAYPPRPQTDSEGQVTPIRMETDMFRAKFEGTDVAGSGEAVDGVYRFIATQTDGEAWHVKLECNYPTVAGRDYFVTYRFRSDVAGTVKFGDFQEFPIRKGENTITGVMIATGGTSYLDLQLGMLQPFTIDFTEIEVKEYADVVDYENALPAPVDFARESLVYEKHDQGYGTILVRSDSVVNVNYAAAPWDPGVWRSRLYVKTGLFPEAGTRYRVTADVMCDQDMPFELLFNNGDEEKGYGALYGQKLTAEKVTICEAVIVGSGDGDELVLQFSLGEAPEGSQVIIGNVRVEKILDHYTSLLPEDFALDKTIETGEILEELVPVSYKNIPLSSSFYSGVDTVYEKHDDGYVVNLEESASSATMNIEKAPANAGDRGVWKAKLYAATGVTPEAGTTYRVKFDVTSTRNQADYEVCFDGDSENAYGALYGRSLTAGGTDSVEYTITPSASSGPLTLRLQLGKTDSSAGNTVMLSNLSVEKLSPQYQPVGDVSFEFGSAGNVSEEHYDGIEQTLSASGNSATLDVTSARSDGGVWSSKLLVQTGFTPEAGEKYRVSAKVSATADTGEFETLYQNTGASDLYGGQWGLSGAGEYSSVFTAPDSGCGELVLVYQLGTTAADNTVTVSDMQVCRISGEKLTDVDLPDFAYPVAGEDVTTNNSFDLEASNGTAATLTGDGSSATATVTTPGDDWHIKLYAKPEVELEAGQTYTIRMDVTGASGIPVCFKRVGGEETDFGTETANEGTVTHTVTPTESGTLEILLKLGALPADTSVTVSGVEITKQTEDFIPQELTDFAYPVVSAGTTKNNSFDLEASNGAAATLTGDGNSATAVVTTPGDDWHIKLYAKPGLVLEAGKTYTIRMDVTGADSIPVCFKRVGGEETDFGTETASGGTVTHTVTPTESGTLEILLKLGDLPADTAVTVSGIRIIKSTTVPTPMSLSGFDYPVYTEPTSKTIPASYAAQSVSVSTANAIAWDGSAATASASGSSATLYVTEARREGEGGIWSTRLEASTGVTLEQGAQYKVSGTLRSEDTVAFEVLYSNGGEEDGSFNPGGMGYSSEISGGTVEAGGSAYFEKIFTVPERSEYRPLYLRVQVGNGPAPNEITVRDIRVEKFIPEHTETTEGYTTYHSFDIEANSGAAASLTGNGSSATATVTTPGDDWNVKLYAKPGVELEAGKTYTVTMNVTGASGIPVCYKRVDGEETDYGTETANGGTVTHTVKPSESGTLEILLKLGHLSAGTTVKVSGIEITEYVPGETDVTPGDFAYPVTEPTSWDYNSFDLETNNGTAATLTGNGKSATATVTTPGDDWHIKLYAKPGFKLEAGKTYQITMNVSGADNIPVCYKRVGGEETDYGTETANEGTVTHTVTPTESGTLEILLKLGALPADTSVEVSDIQIAEYTTGDVDVPAEGFAYPITDASPVIKNSFDLETSNGTDASLTGDGESATATVTKSGDDWHIKLYAKPGVELEAGKTYTVTMNVTGASGIPVCYKRVGGEETDYGTETANGGTVTHTVTASESGTLEILLKLGEVPAGSSVTVRDIAIQRHDGETLDDNQMPDTLTTSTPANVNFWAHEDYAAELSGDSSAASLAISTSPSSGKEAWKVKLFVETGIKLEAGKSYRISADVSASKGTNYEICYNNGAEEKGVGSLGNLYASSAGKTAVFDAKAGSDADLVLQFNLGQAVSPCTVTVRNIKVEEMVEDGAENVLPSFRYNSVGYLSKASDDGYITSLTQNSSSATFRIKQAPSERNTWNAKVIVRTGITPAAGKGYRVTVNINAARAQNQFEIFCDGTEELAYGALYEQVLSAGKNTFSYTIMPGDSKGELMLQLRFGKTNSTSGNTYTISGITIEEVTFVTTQTRVIKSVCENVTQEGYRTQLEKTPDRATVRLIKTPVEGREAWKNKLFVYTGVGFEPGQKYRVSMNVKSIVPAPFEVCFNNLDVEKGIGAIFGLISKPFGQYVEFTTYANQDAHLVIQLSLGNCSTPNNLFLSDVKVERAGEINLVSDTVYFF